MVGKALEVFAYAKAPRATFALKHPKQALRIQTTRWAMRNTAAPKIAAAGAAILALPVGLMLGRLTKRNRNGA